MQLNPYEADPLHGGHSILHEHSQLEVLVLPVSGYNCEKKNSYCVQLLSLR